MKYFVAFLCLLVPALACAPFYPSEFPGQVADERALIVWDAENKVEHFIRSAQFDTQATEVGFVVPTPGQPTISAVDNEILEDLEQLSAPKIVYEKYRVWKPGLLSSFFLAGSSPKLAATQNLEVLERGHVAGQEYAVLKAGDIESLAEWLAKNEFPFPNTHRQWASAYIEDGYYLTAFKYNSESGEGFRSEAVQISFPTEKPFYPYREPESVEARPGRSLKVFLLADGPLRSASWEAKLEFSAPIPEGKLFPQNWLTVYFDRAETRKDKGDLFFESSSEREEIRPPDRVIRSSREIPIPVDLLLFLTLAVVWVLRKR